MRNNILVTSIVAVLFGGLASVCYVLFMNTDTTFIFTSNQAISVFAKTPEAFLESPCPSPIIGDDWSDKVFCNTAYIDAAGNLLVTMSDEQIEQWVQTARQQLEKALENPDVTVSSDYKKVWVYCYKETTTSNMTDGGSASYACKILQLLNGAPAEEVGTEVVLLDSKTKETVYVLASNFESHMLGPYSKEDFSSMDD